MAVHQTVSSSVAAMGEDLPPSHQTADGSSTVMDLTIGCYTLRSYALMDIGSDTDSVTSSEFSIMTVLARNVTCMKLNFWI